MNDSRPPKPKLRWYRFSLRTLLVFVPEANTPSARRSVMSNSAFWSVVPMLAVLTGGCGEGPDKTDPSQNATSKVITNSVGMELVLIEQGEFHNGFARLGR